MNGLKRDGSDAKETLSAKRLIIHQNYDEKSIKNDIALIELNEPAKAKYIELEAEKLPENSPVKVLGWGASSNFSTNLVDAKAIEATFKGDISFLRLKAVLPPYTVE